MWDTDEFRGYRRTTMLAGPIWKMIRRKVFAFLLLLISALSLRAQEPSRFKSIDENSRDNKLPIVVFVRRVDMKLGFVLDKRKYAKEELAFALGELALDRGKDTPIVVILEDSVLMADLKEVPAMAIDAGFGDVRVFLNWKHTGNMAEIVLSRKAGDLAEILFGPVRKKTNDPRKF